MDNILLNGLCDVYTECLKKQHGLQYDLTPSLTKFEKTLARASEVQKEFIKDRYVSELWKIKNDIQKSHRSFYDKIFGNHLQIQRVHMPVTYLFEKLIKGITYFRNEEPVSKIKPIYHRLYSCGPYEDTHRQGNLICTSDLTRAEINRRRSLIERCFIERLIYDELYKVHTLYFPKEKDEDKGYNTQDDGHEFRMKLTRDDFHTCFPDTEIEVTVEHDANMEPVKVIIKKTRNKKTTVLQFAKTYKILKYGMRIHDELVECIKTEGGERYIKVSSFENPGKFQKIQ